METTRKKIMRKEDLEGNLAAVLETRTTSTSLLQPLNKSLPLLPMSIIASSMTMISLTRLCVSSRENTVSF
ncbi:wsv358 [White spot syndrome virus]|uniref:Wsv358 n=4 Tax=White spot syndrome virus TaxID=342409 RepID=Q8VAP3_WSSVS|nr:wsv358 [Shrimp white spot syndrome virus]AFX59735.1 wsv358 [White spot syndrome virus]AAL33360.1 wsv358 [Shrimp white spot syndrome virus]AAL89285.1 WSSV417 [Shrimp white spot syndrome virus]AWQ60485.1 wsv358 [Shrimp white spot syndrome virus]AWQ60930.1 wsv358 [Shrimp white spot syndrome virus]